MDKMTTHTQTVAAGAGCGWIVVDVADVVAGCVDDFLLLGGCVFELIVWGEVAVAAKDVLSEVVDPVLGVGLREFVNDYVFRIRNGFVNVGGGGCCISSCGCCDFRGCSG